MSRQSNDLYSNIELVPDDYSDDKQADSGNSATNLEDEQVTSKANITAVTTQVRTSLQWLPPSREWASFPVTIIIATPLVEKVALRKRKNGAGRKNSSLYCSW